MSQGNETRAKSHLQSSQGKVNLGLKILSTVAEHMNGRLDLHTTLRQGLSEICKLMASPSGWIFLKNQTGGFDLATTFGLPPNLAAENCAALLWSPCRCQRRLLSGNFSEAMNFIPCQRLQCTAGDNLGLRQHVTVPLRRDGEDLGILNLAFPDNQRPFTDDELSVLTVLAEVLGMVVHRARSREVANIMPVEDSRTPVDAVRTTEASQDLERVKQRYEVILRAIEEGILVVDADGMVTFINDAASKLLGYEREELLGKTVHPIFHRTAPDQLPCGSENCPLYPPLSKGETNHCDDYIFWRKDGSSLAVEYTSNPILDADKPAGAVIVFKDITDKKAVKSCQERMTAIIEELPAFVSTADAEGRVVYRNKAGRELRGISAIENMSGGSLFASHPAWAAKVIEEKGLPIAIRDGIWSGETALIGQDGKEIPIFQIILAHKNDDGDVEYFSTIAIDISERKRYEEELVRLATHDPLTGLLNRVGFQRKLERYFTRKSRDSFVAALLYLDLDNIKDINDTLGHHAGDMLLRRFSASLRASFRDTDVIARVGGDEFAVFLPNTSLVTARTMAAKLIERVQRDVVRTYAGIVRPTVSIGIALYPEHGRTIEELLIHADLAMYESKRAKGNIVSIFSPDLAVKKQIASRVTATQRIRTAMAENRLRLYRQPIFDLRSGNIAFYELLLRIEEPGAGIIGPNSFLHMATLSGMMLEIDLWVIRRALSMLANKGDKSELRLTLNLSGGALSDEQFVSALKDELRRSSVNPGSLVFEITERVAIEDLSQAHKHILQLQSMGCSFALDDFGAGFACFDLLKRLPVELVKIDGGFIRNLPNSVVDQRLVKAIVEATRGFGAETVAEFVEKPETLDLLVRLGVDYAQGFYLGRPEPT